MRRIATATMITTRPRTNPNINNKITGMASAMFMPAIYAAFAPVQPEIATRRPMPGNVSTTATGLITIPA